MNPENGKHVKSWRRRRSYFGPILLIVIGLIFLGKNIGLIPGEGWSTIWRLWPVLLIVAGADDLIRGEGIAWPILIIGLGVFLLLQYFYPQSWISWTRLVQFWPLILIAVGIDILFRGQSSWMSVVGVLLALLLFGGAVWMIGGQVEIGANYDQIQENLPTGIESADLEISLDAGELLLRGDAAGNDLISGSITPSAAAGDLNTTGSLAEYSLDSRKPTIFPHTARWELSLNPDLLMDLDISSGVGDMDLELEGLELESLLVNQGVGRMEIDLPSSSEGEIHLKQGVGAVLVRLPEQALIAIDAQNGLSKVDFPAGFELEDGYYVTSGTNPDRADLLITVEQGIGLVEFEYR